MKHQIKIGCWLVLGVIILAGTLLGYSRYANDYDRGLADIVDVIQHADGLQVLEGLPHPGWEWEIFERERSKPHTSHHRHLFYEGEIEISESDKEMLESLFTAGQLIPSSWDVAKACGGFHPDFRVAWRVNGKPEAEAHFCFSCSEVRFYSGVFRCKADFPNSFDAILERLWWPYRTQRPEPKTGEQGAAPNP